MPHYSLSPAAWSVVLHSTFSASVSIRSRCVSSVACVTTQHSSPFPVQGSALATHPDCLVVSVDAPIVLASLQVRDGLPIPVLTLLL